MKIANIDRESFHIVWTTLGISMKFSEKMCLMIMLKVTKNQDFTFSLEIHFWNNHRRRGVMGQIDPRSTLFRFKAY